MENPWGAQHNPDPNAAPPPAPLLHLSDRQRALFLALDRLEPRLARMYLGGLRVLEDEANPDAVPLTAHALRELMEKLPESLDVPVKAPTGELADRVRKLRSLWEETLEKSACHNGGEWEGEIDLPLRELLQSLKAFFEWYSANHQLRREEVISALRRLDPSDRFLPERLEEKNVQTWMALRRFFADVAHHRQDPGRDGLSQQLDQLEQFLLDRLQPRTFEDFDAIDALLKEAGGNA